MCRKAVGLYRHDKMQFSKIPIGCDWVGVSFTNWVLFSEKQANRIGDFGRAAEQRRSGRQSGS